jgi:DNA-binding SARP family transcriptional activator
MSGLPRAGRRPDRGATTNAPRSHHARLRDVVTHALRCALAILGASLIGALPHCDSPASANPAAPTFPHPAARADGTLATPRPGLDLGHSSGVSPLPASTPGPVPSPARMPRTGHAPTDVAVEAGDNIWCLAAEHLSSALGRPATPDDVGPYWLLVIEANRARLVEPSNPDLIYPGQVFVLPAVPSTTNGSVAGDTESPTVPPTPQQPAPNGSVARDTESRTVPRTPQQPAPTAPHAPPVDGSRVPPSPDAPPAPPEDEQTDNDSANTTTVATAPTSTPSSETPHTGTSADGAPSPTDDRTTPPEGRDFAALLAVAAAVTALAAAAGVIKTAARLNGRRHRRQPSPTTAVDEGDETTPPPGWVHEDLDDALARALDGLAIRLAESGRDCRPLVVQHDPRHLEVLLDRPTRPAVPGWQAVADGEVWRLDPVGTSRHDREPRRVGAAPLLVRLGEPDDGGQLSLDLETARVVTLTGDPDVARHVARTLIAELADSSFAGDAEIRVVGTLGPVHTPDHGHVRLVENWEHISAHLTARTDQARDAMAAGGWPNSFVARAHDGSNQALTPLVVVAAEPPGDPGVLDHLRAGPAATAVVSIGTVVRGTAIAPADTDDIVIDCQANLLSLPQLGLTYTPPPPNPAPDTAQPIVEPPDVADHADEWSPDLTSVHRYAGPRSNGSTDTATTSGNPHTAECDDDPPHEILVRFLGEITIDGAPHRLTAKQTALVAYIALHRKASADRVADALWLTPSAATDRKRLANLLTKCRAALGTRHLPTATDNHYAIGPGVTTDLDLFQRRVDAATRMPPAQAAETLRSALDLVRGPVFDYPGTASDSYTWVAVENWVTHWELRITQAAQQAADLYLHLGDPASAIDLADRLHRIFPTDPGLTEALMRSHAAAGDHHTVHRIYQTHLTALDHLDLGPAAYSTTQLHEQLRAS